MTEPVFFWGLGTQKAGTTWLARYLRRRPDVLSPFAKELHAFNYWWDPQSFKWVDWVFKKNIAEFSSSDKAWLKWRAQELKERLKMSGPADYARFFYRRLKPHHRAMGEFTPSYILLPSSVLAQMRDLFPRSKAIVLLRDPASRLLSAAQMQARRHHSPLIKEFEFIMSSEIDLLYGRYEITIPRIEEVFQPDNLLIMFMDQLFRDDSIKRICDFLGLPFIPGEYDRIEHGALPNQEQPSQEMWEKARDVYRDTYFWARQRFGPDLPPKWNAIAQNLAQDSN